MGDRGTAWLFWQLERLESGKYSSQKTLISEIKNYFLIFKNNFKKFDKSSSYNPIKK